MTNAQFLDIPDASPPVIRRDSPVARNLFRCAVERSWNAVSAVKVKGFQTCPESGVNWWVRVSIDLGTGGSYKPPVGRVDNTNYFPPASAPFSDAQRSMGVGIPDLGGGVTDESRQTPFMLLVMHEVGHMLGWGHESDSPNNMQNPDGSWFMCAEGPRSFPRTGSFNALTPLDHASIMQWGYCTNAGTTGLSALDISATQGVYGAPQSDADFDGRPDYMDNCPFVPNPTQVDSNLDAERTLATPPGGCANVSQGLPPLLSDAQACKDYWRAWFKGDACDTTAVTAADLAPSASNLQTGPCEDVWLGTGTPPQIDPQSTCPMTLSRGAVQFDSYISSQTGLSPYTTGNSRPAFCYCPFADDSQQKQQCQGFPYFCEYAKDDQFPTFFADSAKWRRTTWEVNSSGWVADWHGAPQALFGVPTTCMLPHPVTTIWNPFVSWGGGNSEIDRLGQPGAANLPGLFWTRVTSFDGTPPIPARPANLPNNYVGVRNELSVGQRLHYTLSYPLQWRPIGWNHLSPTELVDFTTITTTATGATQITELGRNGAMGISGQFNGGALAALFPVGEGTRELLVGDDVITGRHQFDTLPQAIVVDLNTTRLRAALTKGIGPVTAQTISAGTWSETTLRAYSAVSGMLFALEGTYPTVDLSTRSVSAALAGAPSETLHRISGSIPRNPLAVAWNINANKLFVLDDEVVAFPVVHHRLRLLAIDVSNAISQTVWTTGNAGPTLPVVKAFLTMSRLGEPIISLNLQLGASTSWEAIALHPQDGSPSRSLAGASGSLHYGVVSDGAGFTVLTNQTATENQPNVAISHTAAANLAGGLCGAPWFKSVVGSQVGSPLGDPASECP